MHKHWGKCRQVTCLLLTLLATQCFAQDRNSDDVIIADVVSNFSQLIMSRDSASTEKLLKIDSIEFQYGSLKEYHRYMSSLFRKLNNEGGVVSMDQGDTWFSNGRAYADVTICTRKSVVRGVFELQRSKGGWLISSVP